MFRCGCGMIIGCEKNTGQIVESIENTRREGSKSVGIQFSNRRWLKEGGLWKEQKEQIGETVESIQYTRREGGDGVGVKFNERGN